MSKIVKMKNEDEKSSIVKEKCSSYKLYEHLPKIMKEEEMVKIIKEIRNGDNSNRDKLIEANLRLVVYVARKYYCPNMDQEDLYQEGVLGLIKAINSFDPSKNYKFSTYACVCIKSACSSIVRKKSNIAVHLSLDQPVTGPDGDDNMTFGDTLGTDPDLISVQYEDKNEIEMLYRFVEQLPETDKIIAINRFGLYGRDNLTQKECADIIGKSRTYVHIREKEIVLKFKEYFGVDIAA